MVFAASRCHGFQRSLSLETFVPATNDGFVLLQSKRSTVRLPSPANDANNSSESAGVGHKTPGIASSASGFDIKPQVSPLLKYPHAEPTMTDMFHDTFKFPFMTHDANDSVQSLADFYQEAHSKASDIIPHSHGERTMADMYQESFQQERRGMFQYEVHAASPVALRVSMWVGGLMLTALAGFALIMLVSYRGTQGMREKAPPRSSPSRLLKQCQDVEELPPGTVCAVCLESAGDIGRQQEGEECEVAAAPLEEQLAEAKVTEISASGWCCTPCGHHFHRACLERWLCTDTAVRKRCPLCNWS